MTPRRLIAVVLAAVLLVGATGCSAAPLPGSSVTASIAPSAPPSTTSRSCARSTTTRPAGALHARVDDVDGDGRPDEEWAALQAGGTLRFGVTTSGGATIGAHQGFAGGGERSVVVARLANGVVVALTSEGRDSPVWSLAGCSFRPVLGRYDPAEGIGDGRHFVFAGTDGAGGAGCVRGDLVGWHLRSHAERTTVSAQHVSVSADGRHASPGGSRVVARDVQLTPAQDGHYLGVSCGTAPVLRPEAG